MVKATGPTASMTRNVVGLLRKAGKKQQARIFLEVARLLEVPTRRRAAINLWKLGKLQKKWEGKILVVPGKILGSGEIDGPIQVAALSFSGNARKKISRQGKALPLDEVIRVKPGDLVLVK